MLVIMTVVIPARATLAMTRMFIAMEMVTG